MVQVILGNNMTDDQREENVRTKNIKQTEILVDLREAILQVWKLSTTLLLLLTGTDALVCFI